MTTRKTVKVVFYAVFLISAIAISTFKLTKAYFSDTEESLGNLFGTKSIDLQVGNTDPSTYHFGYTNLKPGHIYENQVAIKSVGEIGGNFSMELYHTDSTEGTNSEAEPDTEGEGELDDCIEFKIVFTNGGNEQVLFDWSFLPAIEGIIHEQAMSTNEIDYWVNTGVATMKLFARVDSCGNEAMGDQLLMNTKFYLSQI